MNDDYTLDDPCDDVVDNADVIAHSIRMLAAEKYCSLMVVGARVVDKKFNAKIARAVADLWVK